MERIVIGEVARSTRSKIKYNSYWFIALILAIIFIRLVLGINIPVAVLLALSFIPIVFGDQNDLMAFAICCIPLSSSFQYKYALFFFIIAYLLKSRLTIFLTKGGIAILILMIWEFFHIIMGEFSIIEYLRSFAEILFLMFVLTMDFSQLDYKKIIRSLAIATIGVCAIMLILQLKQFNFNFMSVFSRGFRMYRFGTQNTSQANFGLNYNANRLGFICNITTTGLLILYGRKEHSRFDIAAMILSMLFGLLTLSRSYIICLLFILLAFVLTVKGSFSKKARTLLGIVLLITIIGFVFINLFPNEVADFIERFSQDDIGNGRSQLFQFYHNHIWSSPVYFLFGVGLQNYGSKINAIQGYIANVCHNGYQEIIVCWGIFGLIMFAVIVYDIIVQSKKYATKHQLMYFLPLVLLGVNVMAGQLISSEIALMSLSFAYIILCIPYKDEYPSIQ